MASVNGRGFAPYARFAPPELLNPTPAEPQTKYQRVVSQRIERSLPVKRSEESAADRWMRERAERKWSEAKAKAAAARYGPRLTSSPADQNANNTAQWNAWFVERFEAFMDDEQGEFIATLGSLIAQERRAVRDYVAKAASELRSEFEAKLASTEEREKQREDS